MPPLTLRLTTKWRRLRSAALLSDGAAGSPTKTKARWSSGRGSLLSDRSAFGASASTRRPSTVSCCSGLPDKLGVVDGLKRERPFAREGGGQVRKVGEGLPYAGEFQEYKRPLAEVCASGA